MKGRPLVKRTPDTVETRVYVYRLYPDPIPDAILRQLHLAHELWNALVALEHRLDQQFDAVWRTMPAIEQVYHDIETLEATYRVATPAEKIALRQSLRTHYRTLARAKTEHRPLVQDALRTTSQHCAADRRREVKALRQSYAAQGLYYGTYNEVIARYERAWRAVTAARRQHDRARLHPRRFDGSGSLTLQIVQTAAKPPLTSALLSQPNGHPYVSQARWTRGDRKDARIQVRLGSTPDHQPVWLTGRLVLHRLWPEEGAVKSIRWVRRRIATHVQDSLQFTVRLPREALGAPPAQRGPRMAIAFGWRTTPKGLRVATWASASTAPVAGVALTTLADIHAWQGSTTGELILPTTWLGAIDQVDRLRQRRDKLFAPIRSAFATWLATWQSDTPNADRIAPFLAELTAAQVSHWQAPNRLAAIVVAWRTARFSGDSAIFDQLETWRLENKHLYEWMANLDDKTRRHRRELYRAFAARVATLYGTVIVERQDFQQLRTRASDTLPEPYRARWMRAQRLATPGELRTALAWAVAKHQGQWLTLDPSPALQACYHCGSLLEGVDQAHHAVITCTHCGATFDASWNHAMNLWNQVPGDRLSSP